MSLKGFNPLTLVILTSFLSFATCGPDKLPSISDMIKAVKEPKKYLLGKCELDAKIEKDVITVELTAQSCKLDLKQLIDHFYPNNKLAEETQHFLLVDMLFMKIEIDKSKKRINFVAKAPNKMDIIKNKLALSDSSVEISFNYEKKFSYENIGVNVEGKVLLGKQPIDVSFVKKEGETVFIAKAISKNVSIKLSVKDVVELIGAEEITAEMFGEDLLKKKILDFEMESIGLEGIFDPKTSNLQLVVSGEVKNNPVAKKINFHVVISKISGEPIKVGVVAKLESIEFENLIQFIAGKKAEIAFLHGKILDVILLAANKDIMLVQSESVINAIKEVPVQDDAAIPGGITLALRFGVQLKNDEDSKVKNSNTQLYIRYSIETKQFDFKFLPPLETKLVESLKMFAKKSLDVELPNWLGKLEAAIQLQKFSFGIDGSLTLSIFVPGDLKIGSILKIDDVSISILRKSDVAKWEFGIESTTLISKDLVLKMSIKKVGSDYELEGIINKISIKSLLKYLVSTDAYTSGDFEKFNLNLLGAKLKWTLSDTKSLPLSVSADVSLANFDGIKFELIALVTGKKSTEWKFGIFIPKTELCQMAKTFLDAEILDGCWLKDVDYMLSLGEIKGEADFSLQSLQGMPKSSKGFFFRIKVTLPKDCKDIEMCKKLKQLSGKKAVKRSGKEKEFVITLEGAIYSKSSFKIAAKLEVEEKISKSLTLNGYELIIEADNAKGSIFFGVNLHLEMQNANLNIKGRVGIATDGDLTLSGLLEGEWKKPFALDNVVIHNLLLTIRFNVAVQLPGLEFGGKVTIGRPESKKKITASLIMSVSLTDIKDIYFYAEVTRMTIDEILDLYGLSAPDTLKDTGFPNGFTVGFTLNSAGTELKTLDKRIGAGLTIIGDVNLFGLQLACNIRIDTEESKISISIKLKSVKVGFITFTNMAGKPDEGPEFYAEVGKSGFDVRIDAMVTVLEISVGVKIEVTKEQFIVTVKGKMLKLFQAELTCKAKYGSLASAEFSVAAKVTFGDELKEEIKSQVEETKKKTQSIMDETEELLKLIERMGVRQEESQKRLQERLKDVEKEIEKDVNSVKKLAEIKDCTKKCKQIYLGGVVFNPKCILASEKNGKKEYVGCPEWKDNIYSYPDLGCIAECKGEGFFSVLWADTKQIAARVSDSIGENVDSAISFLKEVWGKVKEVVAFAKEMYEKVKDLVKAGLAIIAGLIDDILDNVKVTEVTFETSLKAAATAEIELGAKVKSTTYKIRASLRGNFLEKVAEIVIEQVHKGFLSLKEGFFKAKEHINDMAVRIGIVEKEVDKAEEKKNSGKLRKRSTVPTAREMEINKLIYDALPRPLMNDYITMSLFESFKPNSMMPETDALPVEKESVIKDDNPAMRDTINALMNSDSCSHLQYVVKGFSNLSKILQKFKNAFIRQEKEFKKSTNGKRSKLRKMGKSFRKDCKQLLACNDEQLENILYFTKKTREATTEWVKAVRSRIRKQSRESFAIWRRNLDSIYRRTHGMAVKDLANEMYSTTFSRADTRSMIPHKESGHLSLMSKHVKNLFDEDQAITMREAYPMIKELNSEVEKLSKSNITENCGN